jgi:arsenate reductase (glutaredoxin)
LIEDGLDRRTPAEVIAPLIPIGPQDALWAVFLAALNEAKLATDDLLEGNQRFYALVQGDVIGFGGYCRDGEEVLLRSIVVASERRRAGNGRFIVAALLDRSREDGAKRAWLLTTTAQPFFEQFGFAVNRREAAPPEISSTREFSTLCPVTAVLMCLSLA